MGQTKKLLETILELEFDETFYPEDMDMDYEIWLRQREAEQSAYEEMLSDSDKFITFDKN